MLEAVWRQFPLRVAALSAVMLAMGVGIGLLLPGHRTLTDIETLTATVPPPHVERPIPTPGTERLRRGGSVRRFAGDGTRRLGTIALEGPSLLTWRTTAGGFAIRVDGAPTPINSQSMRGSTAVSAGRYRNVEVVASARWTMTLRTTR